RMNPDELERHIMDGSRAARIRIEEVLAAAPNHPVELVGGLYQTNATGDLFLLNPQGHIRVGQIGLMAFEVRIPVNMKNVGLQVPYEALTAAWLAPSGHIMIMLNVRVVWNGTDMTLIPDNA